MTIKRSPFGLTKDGKAVELYTLEDSGTAVEIITYGAAIRSLTVPVKHGPDAGKARDVALGFDDVAGYESNKSFQGAIIGRIANRVGNAQYKMNNKTYNMDVNDGPNCLHGGFAGYDKKLWKAKEGQNSLTLTLLDEATKGLPGDLDAEVIYTLKKGELGIEYIARCSKDTPINLTNHCYFNLGGHNAGSIGDHKIQIFSDCITPIDDTLIPNGELMDVSGTPLDLRKQALIGPGLEKSCQQMDLAGGYDHNWVLSKEPHRELSPAATLEYNDLKMTCMTTKPGIQFYSGNFLTGEIGKGGAVYAKRTGLCLETQYWPNSVNIPSFPAPLLRKGEIYNHLTVYKFE